MQCDVCNISLGSDEGEWMTAEAFRFLLVNGAGIHDSNIETLISEGLSRAGAIETLKSQYMASCSNWLLCSKCVGDAKAKLENKKHRWIDTEHVAVTRTAEEFGHGYHVLGAPVVLTKAVWTRCVEWAEEDNAKQCHQDQEARLWDVLSTGGATLQLAFSQFVRTGHHKYSILCIPRDGEANESSTHNLVMQLKPMHDKDWLVIDLHRH
jgi:hypothetical protein